MDPNAHKTRASPALRISHIVYGRTSENNRVKYFVASDGSEGERAIPEEVVLRRWRQRRLAGHTFSGERLSSTVWRALPAMLGRDVSSWSKYAPEDLRRIRADQRLQLRTSHLRVPAPETLVALLAVCGPEKLGALVERHVDPARIGHSGVPDLFLYARAERSGRFCMERFVEVKKPEEPVSADQHDEIEFMQALGLRARILVLEER